MWKLLFPARGILDLPHCTYHDRRFFQIFFINYGTNLSLEQKQTSMLVMVEMLSWLGKVASSTLKQELGCSLQ